jgi:hypothetical protein
MKNVEYLLLNISFLHSVKRRLEKRFNATYKVYNEQHAIMQITFTEIQ